MNTRSRLLHALSLITVGALAGGCTLPQTSKASAPAPELRWELAADTGRLITSWLSTPEGLLAAGEQGYLLRAHADGTSWQQIPVICPEDFIPPGGSRPVITPHQIPDETPGLGLAPDGAIILVGGVGDTLDSSILRSPDGGRWWHRPDTFETGPLSVVRFGQDGGVAVGAGGAIYRSDDGRSWASVPSGTDFDLASLAITAGGRALAAGEGGVVLRSLDGGRSWEGATFGKADLLACALLDDGRAWVAGRDGTLLGSRDAGATFAVEQIPLSGLSAPAPNLTAVAAQPEGHLLAVGGDRGLVLISHSGQPWAPFPLPAEAGTVTALLFSGPYLLAATVEGRIFRADLRGI